jgi:hypothetical protein
MPRKCMLVTGIICDLTAEGVHPLRCRAGGHSPRREDEAERSDVSARVRDAEGAKRSRERSGRDRARAESGASPGPEGDAPILFPSERTGR